MKIHLPTKLSRTYTSTPGNTVKPIAIHSNIQKPKNLILFKKKHACLRVSVVMFCKQFLDYTFPIDRSAF